MTAPPTQINGLDPISGVADLLTADVPVQDAAGRTYRAPVTMFQDLSALAVQDVSSSVALAEASIAVRADATSGALSVTLPDASGASGQFVYIVKFDAGSNHVTATSKGTDTIEGSATKAITTQWGSLLLLARSGGWDVVATMPVGGSGSVDWTDITDTPTTIAGYGITNAYTKTEVDADIAAALATAEGYTDTGVAAAEAYTDASIAGIGSAITFPDEWVVPASQVDPSPSAVTSGTWTPIDISDDEETFTIDYATYIQVGSGAGSLVTLSAGISFPAITSSAGVNIGGLPVSVGQSGYGAAVITVQAQGPSTDAGTVAGLAVVSSGPDQVNLAYNSPQSLGYLNSPTNGTTVSVNFTVTYTAGS